MTWDGPAYSVTLHPTCITLTLGGVTIPMPAVIAGMVGNALVSAMLEDLTRQRPTPVGVRVPLLEGGIS